MSLQSLRFQPPPVPLTATLRWVLRRGYATAAASAAEVDGPEAAALARRLGIAARIAARAGAAELARELGAEGAAELERERALVVAQEMRLAAALDEVDAAAAALGIPYAPLKGQALVLGGLVPAGARPSADLDLLVAADRLAELEQLLLRRGFVTTGAAYEHQGAPLRNAAGAVVELHRVVLGVRLRGRRSAGFAELEAAGLLEAPEPSGVASRPSGLRLPRHDLLTAHALVHALAQHVLAPGVFSGCLFFADLADLGFCGAGGHSTLDRVAPWIAREVSPAEAAAVLELVTALTSTDERLFDAPPSTARQVLDHFVAGAIDARYAASLKARMFERPLSDRPTPLARAELVARTLFPHRHPRSAGDGAESPLAYAARLLRRPFDLAARWRAARAGGGGPAADRR